ncbi:MAG: PEP-CTERM sorting domain-containing protein [Rubrivivax sp.]
MPVSSSARALGTALTLLLATWAPAAMAQTAYVLRDLGTLGGTSSFARDINNLGQVTGNAQTAAGQPSPRLNAYVWSQPGPLVNIGVLPGSNNFSRGYAINDLGVVVGESDNNSSRAFVYANGVMTGLTRLAGDNDRGVAHGINNSGVIVGISSNGLASRPTRWINGVAGDLGSVDGLSTTSGRAWGLNEAGQVVGHSRRDTATTVSQATFWSGTGGPLNLGSLLPDSFSEAFAINAAGTIAGVAVAGNTSSGTNIRQAVRWTTDGSAYAIEALGSMGRSFSEAKDINNAGQIVGFVSNIGGSPQRAFLYQAGAMVDLNSFIDAASGFTLLSAEGINQRGDIVGWGTFNGQTHAYVLTAVPEPSSAALLLAGLLGAGLWRARRRTTG